MNMNKRFCVNPSDCVEIVTTKEGFGAVEPKTVIDVFLDTLAAHPNEPALCYKRKTGGVFVKITYREYWAECMKFAKSLVQLNVGCFKITNILGFNSHEWFIANCGSILAGCIAAGIYTTNAAEACKYISEHSKAEVVVLEGNKQLQKYVQIASDLPSLKAVVVWGEEIDRSLAGKMRAGVTVYSWEDFQQVGQALPDSAVDSRWANIRPGNCASLIYTSGTTGPPKAVMISHDNITWTAKNLSEHNIQLDHNDSLVSFLPLSHIAAQLIDIYCAMTLGGSVYFAQHDALKGSLVETLVEVRPTFFFGVPRVYEKIYEKMVKVVARKSWLERWIFGVAQWLGRKKSESFQYNGDRSLPFGFWLMEKLVLRKIKTALGLDRSKGCFTAAAPIAEDTLWYFASLDMPVYEVFGQSESTGPHTVSTPAAWRIGYCGRTMQGTESKIDGTTGQLCYNGRHVFMGYLYNEEDTASTFDSDGYFKSGDIGVFDDGFLQITGRIKDLIITAGGENIAPSLIEREVVSEIPELSHCIIIGDKRKFLSALLSLKVENDTKDGSPGNHLNHEVLQRSELLGSSSITYSAVQNDEFWRKYIDERVSKANERAPSSAQKVQKWAWLPVDLSEKEGDITPTMKVKRSLVLGKHKDLIDSLYAEKHK